MRTMLVVLSCAAIVACTAIFVPYSQSGYLPSDANTEQYQRFVLSGLQWNIQHTLGATVEYVEDAGEGTVGRSNREQRRIVIRESLSTVQRTEVMAHEAAHLIQPLNLTMPQSEVWAEAVALRVCKKLGLNITRENQYYKAQFKQAAHVEEDYAYEVEWAATVISGVK